MNLSHLLVPALAAALISYVLAPLVGAIAFRIGAVDRPGPRKVHLVPIPRLGGVAVLGAMLSASVVMYWLTPPGYGTLPTNLWLGIGLGLVPIIGVSMCDDIRALRAYQKFIAHLIGAMIAVSFGISLSEEVHFFGVTMSIGVLALPISVLWLVGVTNAFNIVDGLDGLAAGLGLISSLSLAAIFILVGHPGMAAAALVIAGALAGFLPYNIYPARMFLGDTGATAVGFCLSALALQSGATLSAGFAVLIPVFVLGLPIAETLISVARRVLHRIEEKSAGGVFKADRNHIHHRLLALGIDHRRAVYILYAAGLFLAGAGLVSILMTARDAALFALALLLAGLIGVAKLRYDEFAIIRNGLVLRLYEAPVLKTSMFVVFVDLMIVVVGVYGAVALKTDDWRLETFRSTSYSMIAVLAPISVAVFSLLDVYRSSWRIADAEDFLRISCAVLLASAIGLSADRLLTGDNAVSSVSLFSIYALVSLVLVTSSRASYQIFVAIRRRGRTRGTETLIYGAGRRGAAVLGELTSDPNGGLRAVAFIDDDPDKVGTFVSGVPVVGSLRSMNDALRRFAPRAMIVSSDKISEQRLTEAHLLCQRLGLAFLKMQINFERVDTVEAPLTAASVTVSGVLDGIEPAWATMRMPGAPAPPSGLNRAFIAASRATELKPARVQSEPEKIWTRTSMRCQRCGASSLHRSHARTLLQRVRKKLSRKCVYRCKTCGWHTWSDWMVVSIGQPPTAASPSQYEPMLESIDGILSTHRPSAGRMPPPVYPSSNTVTSQ